MILTGKNGFLLSNLIKNNYITEMPYNVSILFGCPSDKENFNVKTFSKIERDLKSTLINNNFIIYASSVGAEDFNELDEAQALYNRHKRICERIIKNDYAGVLRKNFNILRIPRVYDSSRNSGLIKLLKENRVPKKDMNKRIDFITLDNFIKHTLKETELFKEKIITYPTETMTIREIKKRFVGKV